MQKWLDNGRAGTLEGTTGFGKTQCALFALHELRKEDPDLPITVVVPTLYLQNQWREKMIAEGFTGVSVWVINSLTVGEYAPDELITGVLVLDEIHSYMGPIFVTVFEKVKYKYILGLTATIPDDEENQEVINTHCPVFDVVTLKECLENDWVSPFTIYNLGLDLSEEDMDTYRELSNKIARSFAVFGHNLELAMRCLSSEYARNAYARTLQWDVKRVHVAAINFHRAMNARKNFLYNHPLKLEAAEALVKANKDRLIIVFSQSVETADSLGEMLKKKAVVYHSNVGKKDREKVIEKFENRVGGCHVLCTAKALDMGVDIPHIDMGITLSGTSKALQALQRYGRTLRDVDNKSTLIVEVYFRGTQDEKWLIKRQEKTPKSAIKWVFGIEEIV